MVVNLELNYLNTKEEIIEFLICNQSIFKHHLEELKQAKDILLEREMPIFREEIAMQYDARIRQWIAFYTADRLALPAEYVIIILEKIDIGEFLDV